MKRSRSQVGATVVGVAALAAVLAGCATVTGGGWLAGLNGGRATFGADLTCNENSHLVGSWTYHDKSAGVDVAGTVTDADAVFCNQSGTPGGSVSWFGTYTAQHCSGACTGSFDVTVVDSNGNAGRIKGDTLTITLTGGPNAGYSNTGEIRGGNLKVTA
jgi:hypothetical protein